MLCEADQENKKPYVAVIKVSYFSILDIAM